MRILPLGAFGLLLFAAVATIAQAKIPDQETAALVALYNSSGGDQWLDKSFWLVPASDECTWHGVTCGAADDQGVRHVVQIDLASNNLAGSLPAEIEQLTQLQTLQLHFNKLTGQIPALTDLTKLQVFDGVDNEFTGVIPPLTGLSNLTTFQVTPNAPAVALTGAIPSLAGLTNLRVFDVRTNRLTGSIPSLAGLTNLSVFDVHANQLTGAIPSLAGLTNLTYLDASRNQLDSSIPALAGLVNLATFNVGNDQLTGSIPALTGLTNLKEFFADSNHLTGSIPELAGLSNLVSFTVDSNALTGTIPSLAGLAKLVSFAADSNQLTGTIPALTGLTNLVDFDVGTNDLTGSIPALTGLTHLDFFAVSFNRLTGPIPSLNGLTELSLFAVNSNELSGPIPSIANLADLGFFFVNFNHLTGPIPALDGLPNLRLFAAGNNQLSGPIPSLGHSGLNFFDVRANRLTGTIPPLSNLENLQNFAVDHNQLTGDVPAIAPHLQTATLCPNFLNSTPGPFDAGWNAATGFTPWWSGPSGQETQCSSLYAANLLQNPDFDSGIAGWSFSGNCFQPGFDSVVGSPTGGALAINCFGGADLLEVASQCVTLAAPARVDFSARWTQNGSAPGVGAVDFSVEPFDGPDCSGTKLASYAPNTKKSVAGTACCANSWQEVAFSDQQLPNLTQSVRISLSAAAGADLVFDHIQFGLSDIFQNGFEIAGYISGNWFNVDQSGSGFQLEAIDAKDAVSGLPIMLAIWFTFAPDGSGQNWIFAQGTYDPTGNTATLPAFLNTGARFPTNFKSSDVTTTSWGTLTFTFADCNNGAVSWNSTLPGYGSGSVPIVRLTQIAGMACPKQDGMAAGA